MEPVSEWVGGLAELCCCCCSAFCIFAAALSNNIDCVTPKCVVALAMVVSVGLSNVAAVVVAVGVVVVPLS